jgi:hypothetical protein
VALQLLLFQGRRHSKGELLQVCIVKFALIMYLISFLCFLSACKKYILSDEEACQVFYPKHVMISDRVKTMAEPVIRYVKSYLHDGHYPEWYI